MSVAGEPGGRAQQMRAEAQELEQAAERASDPQGCQRLKDKLVGARGTASRT
ncbi:DUF6381 family protein [Streptomyces sp. NBC_01210]|uniref:DUF6381 family protein n=1 Tax=Streptomyces sp. NBC_01210 TaxID=2903774 RepID=UPI002E10BF59